jgi:hypothetical protein
MIGFEAFLSLHGAVHMKGRLDILSILAKAVAPVSDEKPMICTPIQMNIFGCHEMFIMATGSVSGNHRMNQYISPLHGYVEHPLTTYQIESRTLIGADLRGSWAKLFN